MSKDLSEPDSSEGSPASSFEGPDPPEWDAGVDDGSDGEPSVSFAFDVARMWVQQHQKASMLGAFAVGVFVGAMLRD